MRMSISPTALVIFLGVAPFVVAQNSASLSTNGLFYELSGEGSPIVLIHGTNLDSRLWDGDMDWLRKEGKVLRYDLKGQGKSPLPTERYANHEDLIALLRELNLEGATLVGLSAGAQVALDVALDAPELVNRLVLVSPSLDRFTPKVMPPYLADLVKALRAKNFDEANEILLASSLFAVPDEHKELVRAMAEKNATIWEIPYSLVKMASPVAVKRLEHVKPPTLVLVGNKDMEAVHEIAALLETQIPTVSRINIPNGGHLLNLTSPDEFRRTIADFIKNSTVSK